jgi:fructokinase
MSGVGRDAFGQELLEQIEEWGLPIDLISQVTDKQTGRSNISLQQGSPTFDVVTDVAWDYISLPNEWPAACQPVDAIVFGSIAERSTHNRTTLQDLFAALPAALKVFDANLRPPFDDLPVIWALARLADVLKLSDEEVAVLLDREVSVSDLEACSRDLQAETGCERICITAGAEGGGLLLHGSWYWVDAVPVQVSDTVGAGDSFLAALLHGLLVTPNQAASTLKKAATVASFVAGSDGATPRYESDLLV